MLDFYLASDQHKAVGWKL